MTVSDSELKSAVLYTPLTWSMRLDRLPFFFLYVTAVYLYTIRPMNDVIPWIFGAFSVFLHAVALLSAEWSVDVRCWMSCSHLTTITRDERVRILAKVKPALAMLPKQLCDCHVTPKEETVTFKDQLVPSFYFCYQNLKFYLYENVDTVDGSASIQCRRLDFPSSKTLESYLQSTGIMSTNELHQARSKWGKNGFELPMPKFAELLKEQLAAPFFVFQFFCMLLWCLDEYMYYSLLTLLMLVIFECTVVKQRQQNMDTLLHMRRPPQPCLIFRSGRWRQILSDDLVPGDICSIGQNESDSVIPCDILLLRGNCVVNESMLSGESVPLRKEAVVASIVNEEDKLKNLEIDNGTCMIHKRHVLYGGTKILQHTNSLLKDTLRVSAPPDGGGVGFVLKTGFGTTQGSLMRTILHSSQRVTANNSEAMWFIILLLNFAVVAAAIVFAQGFNDPTRNQFKLFLHCTMIITSVVPPELPMELLLAVTSSLIALTRSNIFCTEPFRIPAAGRIDICCFDKTGTLTSDEFKFHGVTGLKSHIELSDSRKHLGELDINAPEQLPLNTELVLAGCQSLVLLHGRVAGDALERTVFRSIDWSLTSTECKKEGLTSLQPSCYSSHREEIQAIDILHSFAFSSELKRMTTVVCVRKTDNDEQDEQRVLTKGAPEVLESILTNKPSYYGRVYRHYASKGCRVLALGFRLLPENFSVDTLRRKPRCELESALTFAGFLILSCSVKVDTKQTIRELMISKHQVVMVTGDNPLTACDVARQVGINAGYSKQPLILMPNAESGSVEWRPVDDASSDVEDWVVPFNVDEVEKMQVQNDLCVTGEALALLYKQQENKWNDSVTALEGFLAVLKKLCLWTTVFARTSPQQKEYVIMAMNRCGKTTAMCGDGTNDVGALKQAHIGISVVNSSSFENHPHEVGTGKRNGNAGSQEGLRHRRKPKHGDHIVNELPQSLYGNDDANIVRLGDASIASPFTSKSSSIRVMKKLIRQGRCTLVTTIQMYKILGINCLITAYYLSSLFVYGVNSGDWQLTISGLSIAMFFLFMSRAKPARKLSHQRPPSGVFCMSVLMSILGQFLIHLAFLAGALHLAQPFIERGDPAMHPDGKFTPNVVNSIMFLMSTSMQVTTFVANYGGRPFMEGFWENKLFSCSTLFNYAVLALITGEMFTPLNSMLELVAMPNTQTRLALAALMAGNTIVTLGFEHAVQMISYVLA